MHKLVDIFSQFAEITPCDKSTIISKAASFDFNPFEMTVPRRGDPSVKFIDSAWFKRGDFTINFSWAMAKYPFEEVPIFSHGASLKSDPSAFVEVSRDVANWLAMDVADSPVNGDRNKKHPYSIGFRFFETPAGRTRASWNESIEWNHHRVGVLTHISVLYTDGMLQLFRVRQSGKLN